MDADTTDVYRTVEYSRDKWTMNRVPLALLGCALGIAYVVYLDPQPAGLGIVLAFLAMALVVIVSVGGGILLEFVFEGRTSIGRLAAIAILIAILAPLIWYRPLAVFTPMYPRAPHVPAHVAGWAAIMISVGWIAFALFRHFRPRPVVTLSPAGIAYHSGLLKNLLIPWREVEFVGDMEITNATGYPQRYPEVPVVVVSKEFYEQHILVQRSLARGPQRSWDNLLVPKGQSIQFVFHPWLFSLGPKDFREPLEARWKAFWDARPPGDAKPAAQTPFVYGRWSIDGSIWQAIIFLMPLVCLVGILAYSTGIWPR